MIEFMVKRHEFEDRVRLYARERMGTLDCAIVAEHIAKQTVAGDMWPEYSSLDERSAQSLFDALYHCGFRPNKGEGTAAHVDAMRAHLEDLRRVVFERKS